MSTYTYKARDGADLSGYLTVPPGAPATPPPLIVMPHGGPESRDDLSFDHWGQYFATRGYAVFQPNFRGSGGFGRAFAEAGYRQWGARMQDDVTDGVNALIASGKVDANRVCIVGASYGGYAALYGGAAQPDLYKCVVSVAGVSDLSQMMKWQKRVAGSESSRYEYWTKSIGDVQADAARLVEKSPITYAASYKPPVLLFHGELDDIVPVEQSKMMEKALKKAGANVKMILYENEDHSGWTETHSREVLSEIEAFLAAHLR
jgi:dipeptidyl aminopeptidase/acylaminoacyl peptidase